MINLLRLSCEQLFYLYVHVSSKCGVIFNDGQASILPWTKSYLKAKI